MADTDADADGVVDADDRCARTPVGLQVNDAGCSIFNTRLEGLLFASGSAELRPDSVDILTEVVSLLSRYPDVVVEIGAHTDSLGSAKYNRKLSLERARSVQWYLLRRGIAVGRVRARGYGESQPIADNDTAAGRKRNRRVELRIIDATSNGND